MEGITPLDYFKLMVSEDMVASIVAETIHYASQTLRNKELSLNLPFENGLMWQYMKCMRL